MASPTQVAREVFESATRPDLLRPLTALEQSKLARWEREQFGDQPLESVVLGAVEELGELCHAMLKHKQNIRGMGSEVAFLEAAGDAIADCTIFLMQAATKLRLDFTTVVCHTVSDVIKRDWKTPD